MINDFKISFEFFVLNLLEKYFKFVFYLFRFVEKVEILTFSRFEILINEFIDQLLELLWSCINRHGVDTERFVFIVLKLNPNVFGQLWLTLVDFYFFASLHLNN